MVFGMRAAYHMEVPVKEGRLEWAIFDAVAWSYGKEC